VAELAEQHFEGRVSLQTSAQRYLAAAQGAWDLAQFDCSASRGARSRKRFSQFFAALAQAPRWRAARWAVLSLVAVQLGGMALWNWNVQAQLAAKRTAIRALVTSTFTDIQVVVDAPLQMERAVRDLQRQSGTTTGADLETMLVQFYTMAATLPAPTAIDYAGGEVKFKGIDAAAAERTRLSAKLQGLGYTTQLEGDTLVMKQEKTEPRP
jgi:general secretion pathway protein L